MKKFLNKKNIIIASIIVIIIIIIVSYIVVVNKKSIKNIDIKKVNEAIISYSFNSFGKIEDEKVVIELNEDEIKNLKEYLNNINLENEYKTKNVINGIYKVLINDGLEIQFDRTDLDIIKIKKDEKEKIVQVSTEFIQFVDNCLDKGFEEQIELADTNMITVKDQKDVIDLESEVIIDSIKKQVKRMNFNDMTSKLVGIELNEDIIIDFNNGSKMILENNNYLEKYAKLEVEGKETRIIKIQMDLIDRFNFYKQNKTAGYIDLVNSKKCTVVNQDKKIDLNEKETKNIAEFIMLSRITDSKEKLEENLQPKQEDVVVEMDTCKLVTYKNNEINSSILILEDGQYVKIKIGNDLKDYLNTILDK